MKMCSKKSSTRTIAMLLTICMLLSVMIPAVSAEAAENSNVEYVELTEGLVRRFSFGVSYSCTDSEVNGHDYLYVPHGKILFVYDLDEWKKVDEQWVGLNQGYGAYVDSDGIVWVHGSKPSLYRYDPVNKTGKWVSSFASSGFVHDVIEVNGKLYLGTSLKGKMYEYDPDTDTYQDLGTLYDGAGHVSALIYKEGFIYASAQNVTAKKDPQRVVKYDVSNKKVVDSVDVNGYLGGKYVLGITIVGNTLMMATNSQAKMCAVDISGETMSRKDISGFSKGAFTRFSEVVVEPDGNEKVYFFSQEERQSSGGAYGIAGTTSMTYLCEYNSNTGTVSYVEAFPHSTSDDWLYYYMHSRCGSIVTVDRDIEGWTGPSVYTLMPDGTIVLLNLASGKVVEDTTLTKGDGIPETTTCLSHGSVSAGDNKLYAGSFTSDLMSVYDYTTGELKQYPTYSDQVSSTFVHEGKSYVSNYGACSLSEINTETGEVKTLFSLNENRNAKTLLQERIRTFTGGDNKVFVGTVPAKGYLGGYLAWYDYTDAYTYLAVGPDKVIRSNDFAETKNSTWYDVETDEQVTFTHTDGLERNFTGFVPDQMIKTIVYQDGYVYGGTSIASGGNLDPNPEASALLFAYDVEKRKIVTCDLRTIMNEMPDTITQVNGIAADPDVPGKFWGVVMGTLFSFTYDKEAAAFQVKEELSFGRQDYANMFNVWTPLPIVFKDGFIFTNLSTSGTESSKQWLMISKDDPSYNCLLIDTDCRGFVLGNDNNVYTVNMTTQGIRMYKTADRIAEIKANRPGYYKADISTISNVVNKGEQVSINVAVDYKAAEGQEGESGFNAGEIAFNYDSEKLAFNEQASTLGEATVSDGDAGVLKLADYGADKSFGSSVYVLVFDTKADGEATVELTDAAFINKENATSNDLMKAVLGQTDVTIAIDVAHEVTLPDGFIGNLIAEDGEDYTFEAVDENYDYTFTATVGGKNVTVTDNGDGSYTVAAVNGNLVVSVTDKKGKTYEVSYEGTGKDDMTGAGTATYGTDYSFTLPTVEGTVYGVDGITIDGNAYTGYSVNEKTYTIPGSAITGKVVVNVSKNSVPVTNVNVTVEGSGAGAAAGFTATAVKNKAYTLTITPEAGYTYEVTATMGGIAVANMMVEGNAYTIPNVTGDVVFTIEAVVITDGVNVAEYLTLDGTKMWLVKSTTKPAEGKVPTYDGNNMLWSEEYAAYCYLVVAEDLQTDAAKNLLGIREGTSVSVDYGMDVNKTGKVDASDAQLVYDMYNAEYTSFDDSVSMEKFLRADVTADQKVDVNDAAAIIAHVLGIAAN